MQRTGIWKWLAASAVALAASAPFAHASALITLDPPGGVTSGVPGALVGWGFTLANGANWVSIDSVTIENETSPLGGAGGGFTSYMDLLGGLTNGVTPPDQTWTMAFSPGSPGTGLGQYAIDPGTPLGASDSGNFVIYYDEFSADPNVCGSCYVDTLQLFDSNRECPGVYHRRARLHHARARACRPRNDGLGRGAGSKDVFTPRSPAARSGSIGPVAHFRESQLRNREKQTPLSGRFERRTGGPSIAASRPSDKRIGSRHYSRSLQLRIAVPASPAATRYLSHAALPARRARTISSGSCGMAWSPASKLISTT